jgi:hypothetical protein
MVSAAPEAEVVAVALKVSQVSEAAPAALAS